MSKARLQSGFLILAILSILGLTGKPCAAHEEQKYTAQRRPRVTVMEFRDTNATADETAYGESVSAMLVTYLKRKSQFVVVERQDVQSVLTEWTRNQEGQTKQDLTSGQIELLERIDVIIQGSVTMLGNRIEIDGKLLSREDGRIITAAERSGPIDCLRQIVDRLGVALENGFLTPYYGRVQLTIYEPENVHFLLTPILTPNALDEEKPPSELEATTLPGEKKDTIRKWITSPATFMIENVLAGWYTLRLTRGGYEDVKIPNALLRAVETPSGFEVRYHADRRMLPLGQAPDGERLRSLLVRVDRLETNEIDLSARGVEMRKLQGALDFSVFNENKEPLPDARVMMKSVALAINPGYKEALRKKLAEIETARTGGKSVKESSAGEKKTEEGKTKDEGSVLERALYKSLGLMVGSPLGEKADQGETKKKETVCEFFEEERPPAFDHGSRVVRPGESFNPDDFKGGDLYFEEYHGETVPVGMYEVAVWAPRQELRKLTIMVSEDRDLAKLRRVNLERRRQDVLIVGKSTSKVRFTGEETGLEQEYSLDAENGQRSVSLPVDLFDMECDSDGLGTWRRQLDLRPASDEPPAFDDAFMEEPSNGEVGQDSASLPAAVRVKSTIWVGGRFQGFRPFPHTFYNPRVGELLDQILNETSAYDWSSLEADNDKLAALADRLQDVDLLILDEDDMSRIRVFPELAAVIRGYVEGGHALFAFVTREGDYQSVVGRPLTLKRRHFGADRVRLNLEGGSPKFDYDIEVGWRRPLPRVKTKSYRASPEWKIVSYTKKQKKPRVIESGNPVEGGYVMVWFETAGVEARWQSFVDEVTGLRRILKPVGRFFSGGGSRSWKQVAVSLMNENENSTTTNAAAAPADEDGTAVAVSPGTGKPKAEKKQRKMSVEEQIKIGEAKWKARVANDEISLAKTQFNGRALLWAEYLMYRRLDGSNERIGELRERIGRLPIE